MKSFKLGKLTKLAVSNLCQLVVVEFYVVTY